MGVEVKKQNRENSLGLIRRFSKRIKKSRILFRARSIRFHKKEKSGQLKKRAALRREKLREEYIQLEKLAKPKTRR